MESFLIVQRGDDIGRRYDLDAPQLTIGRGADNDLVLNDPMVSRYHAVLKRQGARVALTDLGSSNPVVVNDQALEPGTPHQLNHRDVVFIGKTVFSFQSRGADTRAQPAPAGRAAAGQTQMGTPAMPAADETQFMRPATGNMGAGAPGGPGGPGATGNMGGVGAMSGPGRQEEPVPPPQPPTRASAGDTGRPVSAGPGAGSGDNAQTIIGRIQLGEPAEEQAPPPAPNFPPPPPAQPSSPPPGGGSEDDETPTSVGLRAPGNMPPLPPLGGAPGGPGGPGAPGRPGAPPPPATRSEEDEGEDHPTVFIPRDRH